MPVISAEQLAAALTQGKPVAAVLLLLGQDGFLRESCREQIIEAVVDPAARQWAVQHYSGAQDALEAVVGRARMMPMLAARQVIVFSDLEAIEPAEGSKNEDAVKLLRGYLESPAPFTVLVLEASKLDQRTKFAKMLVEVVPVISADLPEEPAERLRIASRWTKQMAAKDGGAVEDDAAEELASGQLSRALKFLDKLLRDGEQPPALVGALAWTFRKLLEAKDLGQGMSEGQAIGRLGMRPGAARTALRQSEKVSRGQLARGLRALYEADSRLKSGTRDDRAVMEFLLAQLAGGRESAARGG